MRNRIPFAEVYQDVEPEKLEALMNFRRDHPVRQVYGAGVRWTYYISGEGDETVLWLPGATRVADSAHRTMKYLEPHFNIISVDYASVSGLERMSDGLVAILDNEKVEKAHVLSGSFGGMLAQILVRRHPDRVSKLVLSTTSGPTNSKKTKPYKRLFKEASRLKEKNLMPLVADRLFEAIDPPAEDEAFYRAYLRELALNRLDKMQIVTMYESMLEFLRRDDLTPDDLKNWPGQILIISAADDKTFDADDQAALRALYPQAYTYTFENTGHSPATHQPDVFFEMVREFFKGNM